MRVFALSDLHIDYVVNAKWVADISTMDYQDDVLILAGDVTDTLGLLDWCLTTLALRFKKVLFVPGNHDLWVGRERDQKTSLEKFQEVADVVESSGASMQSFHEGRVLIIPLLGWYDYSFGEPSEELRAIWMDYRACRWPSGYDMREVAAHFAALNRTHGGAAEDTVITFSHFMPRIDLLPGLAAGVRGILHPVLGTTRLDQQLRRLNARIHVYGHSHVNRNLRIDGVSYINNAFGYPNETWIASKRLLSVHECQ